MKLPVNLVSESDSIPVKLLELGTGTLLVKPEKHQIQTIYRSLVVRNQRKIFICKVKLLKVDAEGFEVYQPIKLLINDEKRFTERLHVTDLTISNIINQNDIAKFLNDDKIKKVVSENAIRLKVFFDSFKIHVHERFDNRMRLLHTYNIPIFVPDFTNPSTIPPEFMPITEYFRMLSGDPVPKNYRAEICIPIRYRQHATLGYVQALHKSRLDTNSYNLVNLVALSVQKEFEKYKNYEESKEQCKIIDISQADLSFLHSQSVHFSKIFYLGDIIIFDMFFPDGSKQTFRATIRNIRSLEKYYRIGCQFYNMSLDDLEMIEKYLETKKGKSIL